MFCFFFFFFHLNYLNSVTSLFKFLKNEQTLKIREFVFSNPLIKREIDKGSESSP